MLLCQRFADCPSWTVLSTFSAVPLSARCCCLRTEAAMTARPPALGLLLVRLLAHSWGRPAGRWALSPTA